MVDTWTFIREEKCREAMEEVRKVYAEKMKIPMRRAVLESMFTAMKEGACDVPADDL
jgi:hypothetical protein